ncbi:peroxidase-related enzyme [Desulfovibrio sp. JC010]|uniref:peroxidase-related enzyme n=1 Tax=Desulfovibrio sp. JC010 TaxID=2593641 RepID=UPI0013D111EF|nr:peroxidase-related enzyme [Desulfovibrio sp. JC010]NDV28106.1 peroxidase-related enzyme [Desulfovibrio sp. JC010]
MSEVKISRYPVPELSEMPEDVKETILAFQEKLGFIPNVLTALAHRPEEFRAFIAYNNAVMGKESGLSAAEKEMLIIAHSAHNGCVYCVASHGAVMRLETGDPTISEKVAINYREAGLTDRQVAMCDFAMKLTTDSKAVNEADFEVLRGHGLSDDDIWDIAGIVSFFNLSNRMMSFLAVHPDSQFYAMGR